MRRLVLIEALLVAVTCMVGLSAQPPAVSVAGIIRADDSGVPLADIRVIAPDGSRVLSDASGDFQVTLAGPATLTVAKAGYVPQFVPVAAGHGALDIRLIRSAVIAGRVLDDSGEPVIGAAVAVGPTRRPMSAGGVRGQTDDRGEFRIGGLPAGQYFVAVLTSGMVQMALGLNQTVMLPGLHTVFYPGVEQENEAEPIGLTAGQERGIDFVIPARSAERQETGVSGRIVSGVRPSPLSTDQSTGLRGTVQDIDGHALSRAQVVITGMRPATDRLVLQSDSAGRFEVAGLMPGRYNATASKAGYV
jgi:hypothetical protein